MLAALHPAHAADANPRTLVARVNGQAIAHERIDDMLAAAREDDIDITPALRQNAIASAIESVLIEQEAKRRGLLNRPQFRFRLAEARASLVSEMLHGEVEREAVAAARDYAVRLAAARAAQVPRREYLIREIVVGDEPAAQDLLARLQGGAAFGELARTRSIDEMTRFGGGHRSWTDGRDLPPALLQAIESVPVGTLVAAPVPAADGWHVVQVIERREWPLGSDAERDEWAQLTASRELQEEAWKQLVARLEKRAVITRP